MSVGNFSGAREDKGAELAGDSAEAGARTPSSMAETQTTMTTTRQMTIVIARNEEEEGRLRRWKRQW